MMAGSGGFVQELLRRRDDLRAARPRSRKD